MAERRHLYISGTASIHPNGVSAHRGNIDAQIDLTMTVVGALLESGADLGRPSRSIVYFKTGR